MGLHGLISMRNYEASRDRSHHYNLRYYDHGTLLLQCLRRTRLQPKNYVVTCLLQSAAHAYTLRRVTCVVTTECRGRSNEKMASECSQGQLRSGSTLSGSDRRVRDSMVPLRGEAEAEGPRVTYMALSTSDLRLDECHHV